MTHFVSQYGLWVVFAVLFLEVAGLPFIPGEAALITAGALASQGKLNILAVILVAFGAAVLGALVSFEVSRRWGRQLLQRSSWLERHTEKMVERGEEFFRKHGAKAVFLGRFVPVVRALLGWLAGLGKMSFARFRVWNVLGAAAWSTLIGLLAYYAGAAVITAIQQDLLIGIGVIAGIVIVLGGIHVFQRRMEK